MAKIYAVRKGKKTGLFNTWDECKKQVDGFSGAEYKSFKAKEEALVYIGQDIRQETKKEIRNEITAYVDGSYEHCVRLYGSGVVLIKNNEVIKRFSQKGNNPVLVSMRNVAGEIKASTIAMDYCIKNDIDKLILHFDYEGIEKWCTGAWKTNKEGTQLYKKYYDSIKGRLEVEFVKVKAHSGDRYNDEADRLAKLSIGID